jgi:hypothetical protein
VPLDLNIITSLRFTVYDSVGIAQVFLDNVFVDQMQVAVLSVNKIPEMFVQSYFNPQYPMDHSSYKLPEFAGSRIDVAIFDMTGKLVMKQGLVGRNKG